MRTGSAVTERRPLEQSSKRRKVRETAELEALKREAARLDLLFAEDPRAAITAARALASTSAPEDHGPKMVAAGILVDAGQELKDAAAIDEGVAYFRQVHAVVPASPQLDYNLANGISAQVRFRTDPPWSSARCAARREARSLYLRSVALGKSPKDRSKAHTNHANLLRSSYRMLEAYDAYVAALQEEPKNGVASSGVARLLLEFVTEGLGPRELTTLAARYLHHAGASKAEIVELAGPHALKRIDELSATARGQQPEPRRQPSGFAGFVWRHRLALSVSMELLNPSRRFWDDLNLGTVSEPISSGPEIPPVFSMWNVLKADYAAARWLAYAATQPFRERGAYQDTLDYANYGTKQSLVVLAQRAAMDVLDKAAGFASEYLGLPGDPKRTYFVDRWHRGGTRAAVHLEWQEEVGKELEAGNPGLLALGDLAGDLRSDGPLSHRRLLRHAGTHRFIVLHDMLVGSRSSPYVEHHAENAYEAATIDTLQLCRAALFYLRDMVLWRERRLRAESRGRPRGQMIVPPHH